MQLTVSPVNQEYALQILNWRYEAPYDLYNMATSRESMNELIENHYSVVLDEGDKLVGFFVPERLHRYRPGTGGGL